MPVPMMGFSQLISFDDKDISTEYSALMSKVMANGNMRVKFPINEPAEGKKKSQIEEYIEYYKGSGVQHIAVATDDIIGTITALRRRGVEFLEVPDNYYGPELLERVGKIDERLEDLKQLRILVDQFVTQFELKSTKNLRSTKTKDFGSSQDSKLVDNDSDFESSKSCFSG